MADEEIADDDAPKKKSKLPMLIGLVLALAGGGAGFYATFSGMILAPESDSATTSPSEKPAPVGDIAFVPVDQMTISLKSPSNVQHLLFRAQLEVPTSYKADVELLLPRVVDVLNNYLRAVELQDLQDHSALTRLRAQMLRRVQIVTGEGRVNDLLVMEFVLN